MKRIIAMILAAVLLLALLPLGLLVNAETVTVKPFYTVNGSELPKNQSNVYYKQIFTTSSFKKGDTTMKVSALGSSDIPTIAAKLKADFDARPEGTRYVSFDFVSKAIHALVEYNIFLDKAADEILKWTEAFLAEYKRIGGKLDGVSLDIEYIYSGAWYIHLARLDKNDKSAYNNTNIFKDIVNDPRYKTQIRPMLEERGFRFYPADKQTAAKTEIYYIDDNSTKEYSIWNNVMGLLEVEAVHKSVLAPLSKYYPDARLCDYQSRNVYGWQKALNSTSDPILANVYNVGNTSNFNTYSARPSTNVGGGGTNPTYTTPPSYNDALYALTPFNTALWELNIFKNMYDATESGNVSVHIAYFNYNPKREGTYANTPYYTELIYHVALMDPKPLMSYIREEEVFAGGQDSSDPNVEDFEYNIKVVNEIMKELTRVAGASDRKHIPTPVMWNSKFLLSGMYAGGRNIWRITPDTSIGVSKEQFLVKDKAPTFYIDGQTITFPQGRIIEDTKILQVGTCGYWIETPANVMPIVTNDTDRYSKYPSLLQTFEEYENGAEFTTKTALPKATWEVSGSGAKVQTHGADKALALSGTANVKQVQLPENITSGDEYAKQQRWEVTVTLPSAGDVRVLTCTNSDRGIKISDGKVFYPDGTIQKELTGVTLTAGNTYIIRRDLDLNNFKSSYAVLDTNGNRLGGVDDVPLQNFALPVEEIGFYTVGVTDTAYIDDFKVYPLGVTTILEAFDAKTGYKLDNATGVSNKDTAYRLSWMNASSEYKVAKICNNGQVVEEVKMAPGQDGVATGVIKGNNILLSVVVENGSAPAATDYDNGDFSWTAISQSIGLATGKAGANSNTTNPGGNTTNPGGNATTPDTNNPVGGSDSNNPSGNGDATTPNGGSNTDTPGGNQSGNNKPDTNKPDTNKPDNQKPGENKGMDGVTVVLIVVLAVLVLGGGFALLWFIIKPKWLVELKSKLLQRLKK